MRLRSKDGGRERKKDIDIDIDIVYLPYFCTSFRIQKIHILSTRQGLLSRSFL